MTTTYRILATIFGLISGLLFTFQHNYTGLLFASLALISLFIALYLNKTITEETSNSDISKRKGHEFIHHAGFYWKVDLQDNYKYHVHKQPYCPQHQKELGNLSDDILNKDLFCQECGVEESELLPRGRHYQLLDEARVIAEKKYGTSSKDPQNTKEP